jgi:hypothetical protein
MAKPIGPGMCVRCVRTWKSMGHATSYDVTQDAIYFVEEVSRWSYGTCPIDACDRAIALRERPIIMPSGHRLGYCISLFAPLDDGDTSLVEDEIVEGGGIYQETKETTT